MPTHIMKAGDQAYCAPPVKTAVCSQYGIRPEYGTRGISHPRNGRAPAGAPPTSRPPLAVREDGGVAWSSDGAPFAHPVSCLLSAVCLVMHSLISANNTPRNHAHMGMDGHGFATTTTSMPQHLVSNNTKSGSSREPGPTGQEDDRERGYGQKKDAKGGGRGGGRDAPAVPAEYTLRALPLSL
jgi:hypothetical protein